MLSRVLDQESLRHVPQTGAISGACKTRKFIWFIHKGLEVYDANGKAGRSINRSNGWRAGENRLEHANLITQEFAEVCLDWNILENSLYFGIHEQKITNPAKKNFIEQFLRCSANVWVFFAFCLMNWLPCICSLDCLTSVYRFLMNLHQPINSYNLAHLVLSVDKRSLIVGSFQGSLVKKCWRSLGRYLRSTSKIKILKFKHSVSDAI